MSFTKVNSAMIALARDARGWTQRDLAKAIGITQSTISRYELGTLPVSAEHLDAMSRALDFEPQFFEQPDPPLSLGGDFLYRKRASLPARAQRRVEAEANIRRMQLARLLRAGLVEESFPFPAIQPDEVGGRVERIAQEVRNAFRLPRGPIKNLTRVLENAGAVIFTVDFGSDRIDGTNLRVPGLPPMLFVNRNVPGERHRFNLAHELGHAVMHFSTALDDPEEEANAFAREFLMPKAEIRHDLRNLNLTTAMRLKKVWGVSMAALIVQAYRLKIINKTRYTRLYRELSAKGYRTDEPFPLPFEQPETFDRLLRLHRDDLRLSDDDLRRLLFTDNLGESEVPPDQPRLRLTSLFDQDNRIA